MNRETTKKVCTVIVGVSAIVLILAIAQLFFIALSADYLVEIGQADLMQKHTVLIGKWTALSLCFVLIADGVVSVLNYIFKSKPLGFLTGGLYVFTALLSIAFLIAVYLTAKNFYQATVLTTAVSFCEQYANVAVASAVIGAFYTTCAVKSVLKPKGAKEEQDGENGGEENEENV